MDVEILRSHSSGVWQVLCGPGVAWAVLACLHGLGLISAVLARLPAGAAGHALFRRAFFFSLATIAGAVVVSYVMGQDHWLGFGGTFSAMVLTATSDFGSGRV